MTQEQIQDALGMIDDDLIESVDKLRQKRDSHSVLKEVDFSQQDFLFFRKKIIRREIAKWGTLAASVCLLIGVGFLWTVGGNKTADLAGEADSLFSNQENASPMEEYPLYNEHSVISDSTSPETNGMVYPSPPQLFLATEEGLIPAMTGTYSWRCPGSDGTTMFVEADSYHPLQSQKFLPVIETRESFIQLQFDSSYVPPYDMSIQCWSDVHWDDIRAKGQSITAVDNKIPLFEGGYIYEITAKWSSGIVHYAFYARYTP